jgi:hypothetical protein
MSSSFDASAPSHHSHGFESKLVLAGGRGGIPSGFIAEIDRVFIPEEIGVMTIAFESIGND